MTLIVDSREPPEFRLIGDEVRFMTYGDYVIEVGEQKLILERKTISDFWKSLTKGRLNNQLKGCHGLIIYDSKPHMKIAHWFDQPQRVYDAINGISNHHKVYWIENIPHLMNTLRRYEDRMEMGTFGDFHEIITKDEYPTAVRMLAAVPLIGVNKAKELIDHYHSIDEIRRELVDKYPDVEMPPNGIGVKSVEELRKAIYG